MQRTAAAGLVSAFTPHLLLRVFLKVYAPSDSRAGAKVALGYCQLCTAVNQEPAFTHCLVGMFSVGNFLRDVYPESERVQGLGSQLCVSKH